MNRLKSEFGDKFSTEEIPNGNSPEELWKIFNKCINVFDGNENDAEVKIILDITHAFRSIPLLIFIVAAYLRQVKNIELEHIIYGAFEARDQDANETRIFDLTPFVELLDWMNAVNVFQNYGDARPIAKLNVQDKIAETLPDFGYAFPFEGNENRIHRIPRSNLPNSLSECLSLFECNENKHIHSPIRLVKIVKPAFASLPAPY